jgi:hypothetical protein
VYRSGETTLNNMTKNRKSRRKSQHRKFESKSTSETKYDGDNAIAVALDSTTSSQSYLHEVVSKSGVATELSISISSVESSNKERKNVLVHEELSLSFSETNSKKRKRNEPEAETYRDNNGNSGANKRWLIDDCVETRSGMCFLILLKRWTNAYIEAKQKCSKTFCWVNTYAI